MTLTSSSNVNFRVLFVRVPVLALFDFIGQLMMRPQARVVAPGPKHMQIFERLCRQTGATGKLAADAQHAAVAIEHGCTLATTDADFSRFPQVRWQHPLQG
jgi:uncharacterized protein